MRFRLTRIVLVVGLATGSLAACGDDDGASPSADPGPGADTPSDPDGDATNGEDDSPGGGGSSDGGGSSIDLSDWPPEGDDLSGTGAAGTVTIDGTTYGIDVTVGCDLTDFAAGDNRERLWEIQGAGIEDPERPWEDPVVVKVWTGTTSRDRDNQGIGWNGPEGIFDGEAAGDEVWTEASNVLDGPPLDITDDRVTGELLLRSAMGRDPVVGTVDLALPDVEGVSCY